MQSSLSSSTQDDTVTSGPFPGSMSATGGSISRAQQATTEEIAIQAAKQQLQPAKSPPIKVGAVTEPPTATKHSGCLYLASVWHLLQPMVSSCLDVFDCPTFSMVSVTSLTFRFWQPSSVVHDVYPTTLPYVQVLPHGAM